LVYPGLNPVHPYFGVVRLLWIPFFHF
jgi:hypothetical protein